MTGPSYTPTIEQVAEALGDPGIRLSHEVLGGVPSVTLRAGDNALVQFVRHDAIRYIVAAQCEASALRTAWGAIGVGDAERAGLRRAAGSAPPADFVPTIEQVAEALGEPLAHVAPWCWRRAGTVPVWLWRLRTERGPVVGGEAYRATDYYVTGPTRADALRAAWAYIASRQEPTP